MAIGRTEELEPVGICIYCGSPDELTDEHIVPVGLNGNLKLRKASCKKCAVVTSRAEDYCLRHMFLVARTKLDMRTRRPRKRPKEFKARNIATGNAIQISAKDHPHVLSLPILTPPPILTGKALRSEWVGFQEPFFWQAAFYKSDEDKQQLKLFLKEHTPFVGDKFDLKLFCLMLAKIANAATVAWYGYGTFHSFLPRIIRTESTDVHDYVGRARQRGPEINRETVFHTYIEEKDGYIVATLTPFADHGAPSYEVVVGMHRIVEVSLSPHSLC